MAQPLPYDRAFDFESYQAGAPSTPLPGLRINQELDQVAATIDEVLARIAQLQDDDNRLKRLSVGFDQLAPEVRNGFTTPTVWATGVQYARGASVYRNQRVYAAVSAHVSSAFATDLANGRWVLLADFTELTVVSQGVADNAAAAAAAAANALSYRDSALSAKSDAEAAATVSSAASSAAIAARDLAELWASEDEDVVVAGGRYSALHWAQKAEATVAGKLSADQNLADLADPAAGRVNLGLGSSAVAALIDDDTFATATSSNINSAEATRLGKLQKVANRTALAGLSGADHSSVYLEEAGREGDFIFDDSDLSAQVTADAAQATFIPPAGDLTGVTGAWVRRRKGPVIATEAGVSVGKDGVANATAFANLMDYFDLTGIKGGQLFIPAGTFNIAASGAIDAFTGIPVISNVHISGAGRGATVLFLANGANARVFQAADSPSNISIRSLTIDGNRDNQSAGVHAIQANGVSDFAFEDLEILNARAYGIGFQGGAIRDGVCRGLRIRQSGDDGIDLKNFDDDNDGLIFDDILIDEFAALGASGKAGLDIRGPALVTNVWVKVPATANSLNAIRFRVSDPGGNGIGGKQSSLTNFRVVGQGNNVGLSIDDPDIAVANGRLMDLQTGVNVSSAGANFRAANVVASGCTVRGFSIAAARSRLAQCVGTDCFDSFRFLSGGDGAMLHGCMSIGATNQGYRRDDGVSNPVLLNCLSVTDASSVNDATRFDVVGGEGFPSNVLVKLKDATQRATQFEIGATASTVNWLRADGNVAAGSPALSAVGADTNLDLRLVPKGSGTVRFGTGAAASSAGAFSADNYLTMKLASGTTIRIPYMTSTW